MRWRESWRADPAAKALADRHYNRQNPDSAQFVPPGRCVVLVADRAVWVTSWPIAEYVQHDWAGAWVNSLFRNEGEELSSALISQAVAATRHYWPDPPPLGIVTMVDRRKVRSKRDPGYCYLMAGFQLAGETKGGLLVFQLLPEQMPTAQAPLGTNMAML